MTLQEAKDKYEGKWCIEKIRNKRIYISSVNDKNGTLTLRLGSRIDINGKEVEEIDIEITFNTYFTLLEYNET